MPKTIPLTRGYSAIVDDEDYEALIRFRWFAKITRPNAAPYACCGFSPGRTPRFILMHRIVAGATKGENVDHINGNRLDNRRSNLRICSIEEQNWNRGPNRGRKLKGVTRDKNKFRATIRAHKKIYRLGFFDTPEEAAAAYDAKAIELHGEFARLNFPRQEAA